MGKYSLRYNPFPLQCFILILYKPVQGGQLKLFRRFFQEGRRYPFRKYIKSGPIKNIFIIENHINSAVIEIFYYRQTQILLIFKDTFNIVLLIERKLTGGSRLLVSRPFSRRSSGPNSLLKQKLKVFVCKKSARQISFTSVETFLSLAITQVELGISLK